MRPWVWGMVAAFALAFTLGLQIEALRDFFAVEVPTADAWWVIAACSAGGIALLVAVRRIPWLARMEAGPPDELGPAADGLHGYDPAMPTNPYGPSDPAKRHSAAITDGPDRAPARAMLKGTGFTDEDLARPLIGVATTWIETMPCNLNQRELAVARQARRPRRGRHADGAEHDLGLRRRRRWAPRACARRWSRAR